MNIEKMVRENLIFQVVGGSHAYGLNTPESDYDKLGAFIPYPEFMIGLNNIEHFRNTVEDESYVPINVFVKHLHVGSSYWVETLFVEQSEMLVNTKYWQSIYDHRDEFLTIALIKKSLGFIQGEKTVLKNLMNSRNSL